MFEHHNQPLLHSLEWISRIIKSVWLAGIIVLSTLIIGIAGYHFIGGLAWVDAILESSMILGGMGAIAPMNTDAIKLFASIYALFSGFVVLTSAAIIIAPWLHRLLHHFHSTKGIADKNPKQQEIKHTKD